MYNFIIQLVCAAILGVALTFGFSPYDSFCTLLISVTGFISLLRYFFKVSAYRKFSTGVYIKAFAIGYVYGFAHFCSSLYWIANALRIDEGLYGWLIPVAICAIPAVMAVFTAFFAIVLVWVMDVLFVCKEGRYSVCREVVTFGRACLFAFLSGILWVACELLRSYLILPFPWQILGYASAYSIEMMQLAHYISVYGISFIIIFVCTLISIRTRASVSFAILICIVVYAAGYYRLQLGGDDVHSGISVRLVQSNFYPNSDSHYISKLEKIQRVAQISDIDNDDGSVDYVIWAEAMLDLQQYDGSTTAYSSSLLDYASSLLKGKALLSGAILCDVATERSYNSIVLLNGGGITSRYDKRILVPFGEYVPFYDILSVIPVASVFGQFAFATGDSNQNNFTLTGNDGSKVRLAPLICYEAIFPFPYFRNNLHNADVIVNLTNDAWFGESIGPWQHMQMARMRAIEYGIPMLRVANGGISAHIDSKGRLIQSISFGKDGYIDATV